MPSSPADLLRRQHTIVRLRERLLGADALVSPGAAFRRRKRDEARERATARDWEVWRAAAAARDRDPDNPMLTAKRRAELRAALA